MLGLNADKRTAKFETPELSETIALSVLIGIAMMTADCRNMCSSMMGMRPSPTQMHHQPIKILLRMSSSATIFTLAIVLVAGTNFLTIKTYSSAHSFSRRIWSSSSGVKSHWMLKVLRISSGVLPLIMLATVLHPTSSSGLISR